MNLQRICLAALTVFALAPGAYAQGSGSESTTPTTSISIANHSFEADSVTAFPTYRTSITSWTKVGAGTFGVNTTTGDHPFLDNGSVPDGSKVLFLQNQVGISQNLSGFLANRTYELRIRVNARAGTSAAQVRVSVGGAVVIPDTSVSNVAPVGNHTVPFILLQQNFRPSTGGSLELKIENTRGGGDNSLLIDQVEIVPGVAASRDWSLYN